jgi:hypothetical protein
MSTTPEPVDTRSSEVTYMGRRPLSTATNALSRRRGVNARHDRGDQRTC